jgi:hypothetical protein
MGISHRKAGTVVRCPKCAGQVVVPEDAPSPEPGAAPGPDAPNLLEDPELELLLAGAAKDVGGAKPKPKRKSSKLYPEVDVEPLDPPAREIPVPMPAPAPVPPPAPAPSSMSSPAVQASLHGLLIPHNVIMVGGVVVVVLIGAAFLFGFYIGRGT